jgi:6-phosphogluconate dehydrogenase (decarboxylating)
LIGQLKTELELVKEKAVGAASLAEFTERLAKPRAIWLMVPVGVVDDVIADLLPHLERGDILVDGGNSYYIDDIHRARELTPKGRRRRRLTTGAQLRIGPCQPADRSSIWALSYSVPYLSQKL